MKVRRYVSSIPALTYDPHIGVVEVIVSVDDKGRRWRRINGGPDELIESPEEPKPPKRVS